MTLEDQYKILIGAYYGIESMDNYSIKEYLLKEIREHMKSFIDTNPIDFDYKDLEKTYNEQTSLKVKLQDSLILLNRINAPIDIILLVKEKLREIS